MYTKNITIIMYIHIFTKFLIVLAAINYLFISELGTDIFSMLGGKGVTRIVYVIVGLTGLYYLLKRDFYLPFLGPTIIPIPEAPLPKDLIDVTLHNLPPKTRILYWAAAPSDVVSEDPLLAYNLYSNSGIGYTDSQGTLTAKIGCPGQYRVGLRKRLLKQHMHFRYEYPKYKGLFSKVYTVNIHC